jgi:hypothetical protein
MTNAMNNTNAHAPLGLVLLKRNCHRAVPDADARAPLGQLRQSLHLEERSKVPKREEAVSCWLLANLKPSTLNLKL